MGRPLKTDRPLVPVTVRVEASDLSDADDIVGKVPQVFEMDRASVIRLAVKLGMPLARSELLRK